MIFFILFIQIVLIYCQDNNLPEYDSIVIGNLRKRDQIPLYQRFNRRWDQENLNYRRTRDIREDNYFDRKYELPSDSESRNLANMPDLRSRLQVPLNLLNRRRNDIDLNDFRRINSKKDDDNFVRGYEMSELRKEEIFKEEAQKDLERLQHELKWFTVTEEN